MSAIFFPFTLPIASENWPSEKETIVFQASIFRCKLLVSGRVTGNLFDPIFLFVEAGKLHKKHSLYSLGLPSPELFVTWSFPNNCHHWQQLSPPSCHDHTGEVCQNLRSRATKKKTARLSMGSYVLPRKKNMLLSMKSWLLNRDPCIGLFESLHNGVWSHPWNILVV